MNQTMTKVKTQVEEAHAEATIAAANAAEQYRQDVLGGHDQMPCGFAWVKIHEKASTRLGKALKGVGYRGAYGGGMDFQNPSRSNLQNVDAKIAGARAYAAVMASHGIVVDVESRWD